jgi:hypothetical protein
MPPQTEAAMWAKFQSVNHVVQVVTRKNSSKPYAQIEDAGSRRSGRHATNILAGKQLRCTSCHGQIVVGTHLEVTDSTCYLCHLKPVPGQ